MGQKASLGYMSPYLKINKYIKPKLVSSARCTLPQGSRAWGLSWASNINQSRSLCLLFPKLREGRECSCWGWVQALLKCLPPFLGSTLPGSCPRWGPVDFGFLGSQ